MTVSVSYRYLAAAQWLSLAGNPEIKFMFIVKFMAKRCYSYYRELLALKAADKL